jgi:hypothetical protein
VYSAATRRILRPLNGWAPFVYSTVPQEQVDEILIRHPQFGSHILEVIDRRGIKANGYLPLELLGVGIFAGFGKIVFFSHLVFRYISSSGLVARLAEISRITESDCR